MLASPRGLQHLFDLLRRGAHTARHPHQDDSGVVVPASRAGEVLAIAREIEHTEQEILKRIAKGQSLREARAELQYH